MRRFAHQPYAAELADAAGHAVADVPAHVLLELMGQLHVGRTEPDAPVDALAVILHLTPFPGRGNHVVPADVCLINHQLRHVQGQAKGVLRFRAEVAAHLLPDQLSLAALAPEDTPGPGEQKHEQGRKPPADVA